MIELDEEPVEPELQLNHIITMNDIIECLRLGYTQEQNYKNIAGFLCGAKLFGKFKSIELKPTAKTIF